MERNRSFSILGPMADNYLHFVVTVNTCMISESVKNYFRMTVKSPWVSKSIRLFSVLNGNIDFYMRQFLNESAQNRSCVVLDVKACFWMCTEGFYLRSNFEFLPRSLPGVAPLDGLAQPQSLSLSRVPAGQVPLSGSFCRQRRSLRSACILIETTFLFLSQGCQKSLWLVCGTSSLPIWRGASCKIHMALLRGPQRGGEGC